MDTEFNRLIKAKHSMCRCQKPWLLHSIRSKIVGVDLDLANQGRSDRLAVYKSMCGGCGKSLTHCVIFASLKTVGIDNLKNLAILKFGKLIRWNEIVTSSKVE